ncbi:hypothetical protein [Subtercola sp. YIM 133946]|uniref:hypothetical protein n=1 Tax=Subtercola sp. YIM 133946 TaxID=3118909 RepID=UPI002F91ED71
MPWWSWVVIWVGLTLGLFGMLALAGYRLFRKATAVLAELARLGDQIAKVNDNVTALAPERNLPNAILEGYPAVSRRRDAYQQRREDRKQVRREKVLLRGKLLVRTDYRQRTWPHAR